MCSVTFHEAAAAGIDGLEHGVVVATDFVADKKADRCPSGSAAGDALLALKADGPEMTELIQTLVRRKVAVTSTLAVFAAGIVNWFPAADDLAMLNEQSQLWAWQRLAAINRAPERRERGARLLQAEMQFEKAFVAAGGTLLVGTDPTGWGGTLPGPGNHAALRLLVEAGFTPLEVIRIATLGGRPLPAHRRSRRHARRRQAGRSAAHRRQAGRGHRAALAASISCSRTELPSTRSG